MSLWLERHGDVQRLRMISQAGRAMNLGVSAYVVNGVMVDTGFPRVRRALLTAVRSLGVRAAIVTHWHEDHAGNVAALAAHGVPMLVRGDTADILRARPDIQLYRRAIWGRPPRLDASVQAFDGGGLEVVHTPGHSPDHQVVWDARTHTLFSGDLWLGVHARVLHVDEDPYEIVNSLRIALALGPERMFDAHRGFVEHPVVALRAKIEWLGATLVEIERQITTGSSDHEIVKRVLGGEELAATMSRGEYARRNLIRAVRRKLAIA